uniref:Uncharacterized protein n=1 Tax=Tanacetum cinerariifolium TaxID=118510 RepID=A0A6L2L4I4_TANCI|nr:hypothetical protein [Tanacetum cinerariifolium]
MLVYGKGLWGRKDSTFYDSPTASVPLSSPILGALSYARTKLLPSPKRIKSSEFATDLEGCSEDSFEPYAEIDECIAYADAFRDRRNDARVVVEAEEVIVKVTYETLGDLVLRFHDHTIKIPVHRVHAIEGIQRDQGHRIISTIQQSIDILERIGELERVNMRIRDIMDIAS